MSEKIGDRLADGRSGMARNAPAPARRGLPAKGLMDRERPGGAGGMGLHMPNRPCAAPGIPKGRVAPVHGPETRIGTGDPRAVAQPQAVRRLAEPAFRTLGRDFLAQAPRCRFHTSGSATSSPERRSNPDSRKAARTPHRMAVNRASGTRQPEQFPHLGDLEEAGLKAAISATASSSMPKMAFSMRVISRRAATAVPGGWMGCGAVSVLV